MVITIDGPVASGKSSVARLLARELDCIYVSSGMLYRALAYLLRNYMQYSDHEFATISHATITSLISDLQYAIDEQGKSRIIFKESDITAELKAPQVDRDTSLISPDPFVRAELQKLQRTIVGNATAVVEGRDAGTVVFPNAEYKIFLDAALDIRAGRWQADQKARGLVVTLEEARQAISDRDYKDTHRAHGALKSAHNAWHIDASKLSLQEVVQLIISKVTAK